MNKETVETLAKTSQPYFGTEKNDDDGDDRHHHIVKAVQVKTDDSNFISLTSF